MTIPTMAPPTVTALAVTPTKTTRLVIVRCPYCRHKHVHGWPYGQDDIGHRLTHCVGRHAAPGQGYTIVPPANYQDQEAIR